eukprot:1567409-Rhodomonas_salina.1
MSGLGLGSGVHRTMHMMLMMQFKFQGNPPQCLRLTKIAKSSGPGCARLLRAARDAEVSPRDSQAATQPEASQLRGVQAASVTLTVSEEPRAAAPLGKGLPAVLTSP